MANDVTLNATRGPIAVEIIEDRGDRVIVRVVATGETLDVPAGSLNR